TGLLEDLQQFGAERAPTEARLDALYQNQLPRGSGGPASGETCRRPGDTSSDAVDESDSGPIGLVIVIPLRPDLGQLRGIPGQGHMFDDACRGFRRVVPPFEGCDDDRPVRTPGRVSITVCSAHNPSL